VKKIGVAKQMPKPAPGSVDQDLLYGKGQKKKMKKSFENTNPDTGGRGPPRLESLSGTLYGV